MSNADQLNFKHVLIVGPVSKRGKGLASVLQTYLPDAKFSFLSHVHHLTRNQLDGLKADLMIIELSKNKSAIYKWYSKDGYGDSMPPAIFLGHPASINDAGYFYRAGASDYIEMRGLKRKRLLSALVVTSKMLEKPEVTVSSESHDNQDTTVARTVCLPADHQLPVLHSGPAAGRSRRNSGDRARRCRVDDRVGDAG